MQHYEILALEKTFVNINLTDRFPEKQNCCHLYACVHLTVAHKIAKLLDVVFLQPPKIILGRVIYKVNLKTEDYGITTAPVPPAQLTNPGHAQFLPLKDNSNHGVDDAPSD